jgi:hypothetical protein
MASQRDVVLLKRDTSQLIAAEGRLVALERKATWERTAEGGQRRTGATTTEDPAVKRFFLMLRGEARYVEGVNGEMMLAEAVLLGMPDDDIRQLDTFMLDGRSWEVFSVDTDQRYETRAHCRDIT